MAAPKCIEECPPFPVVDGVEIRHIPGFCGYAAGNDGTIWSCCNKGQKVFVRWRMLKLSEPSPTRRYPAVFISVNKKSTALVVSRAVLMAFVGPPPEGMEAAHFPDKDVKNNRLENLSWKTPIENAKDKDFHGTIARGSKCGRAKLKETHISEIRRMKSLGVSTKDIAKEFGICRCNVNKIVSRNTWKHVP